MADQLDSGPTTKATLSDPHVLHLHFSRPSTFLRYLSRAGMSSRDLRYVSRFLTYLNSIDRECLFSHLAPRGHARRLPFFCCSRLQRFRMRPSPRQTLLPTRWAHRILIDNSVFPLVNPSCCQVNKTNEGSDSRPVRWDLQRWPSTRLSFGTACAMRGA